MTRRFHIRVMLMFFLGTCAAAGQSFNAGTPAERVLVGISGGMTFAWHQGSYTTGDAQFDCCTFSGGNGIGRDVGLRAIIPIGERSVLRPGVGFEQFNADYPAERDAFPVLGPDDQVTLMTLEEQLSVSLDVFTIELLYAYRIVNPGMYLLVGPSWSIPMSKHQTQEERIISPAGLTFADGHRVHLLVDSEIREIGPFFSLRAGAGALFPLSEQFHANPEISFLFPVTAVADSGEWSVAGFTLTFAVLLAL